MISTHPARRRFRAQIAHPDDQINLAEAALCIAWEDRGGPGPDQALDELDQIAVAARERIAGLDEAPARVQALNTFLFDDLGFRGNTWSYGEPENSFVDHALQTRAGLPITLSLIYLEVGWRLGLPVAGVALPGHFIVRYLADAESFFIDPFHRGRRWSMAECVTQIRLFYGDSSPETVAFVLQPPTRRAILARMLRNLKGAYIERGQTARALAAVERVLLLDPEAAQDMRDRGLLRARMGMRHLALEDLDAYARHSRDAADIPTVRRHAERLVEQIGRLS